MKFKQKRWTKLGLRPLQQLILAFILPLLFGCDQNLLIMASSSEAQPAPTPRQKPNPSPSKTQRRKQFIFKSANDGASGKREGAATRGCSSDNNKPRLTGLIPGKNMGLTMSDRPTFWFYVPYLASSTTPVEFKLTNFDDKEIYKQNLQLKNTPGIISITLPKNAPALELDQNYEWSLGINCDSQIDNVNGRIKRVKASAEVTKQLQENRGRDRLLVYAENSFWYETLTGLIELRRQNPQDEGLKEDWENLLKSNEIGLENLASEPIVSCCKPK